MVVARRGADTAATVLRFIGLAFVLILVLHILLTLLANPGHEVTQLVARAADYLDLGLDGLFVPDSPQVAVLLNYGVAALLWYLITIVVVRLVQRLG
ncbi:hypothetical protein [Pseudonocardia humida]|uniref:YGGT family protein n=1 Tax=Pseudonocardia humida TaxID=2800819 RepID=A0ABT1A8I5_9PSEU|nr:hypothetical protein [Pseudonocardia humida]MCO1659276.1 hypothetical protein [Pseudonocardia humida]